jgi:hypothetical protein
MGTAIYCWRNAGGRSQGAVGLYHRTMAVTKSDGAGGQLSRTAVGSLTLGEDETNNGAGTTAPGASPAEVQV